MSDAVCVIDAINAGRYENKVPRSVDTVPVDEESMTVRQAREHKEAEARRKSDQRALHQIEEARLHDLFKADLENEYGVSGHPKASLLFSVAWQKGHSGGYHDVACQYSELVELIR